MLVDSFLPHPSHQRKFEEDTAVSIIRREGFPPSTTQHGHVPHVYGCPCCNCLSPRKRLPSDGPSAADIDRRRRMQWDIFEERALSTRGGPFSATGGKGISSHRNVLRRFYATLQRPITYQTRAMYNPPAPQTVEALRHQNNTAAPVGSAPAPADQNTTRQHGAVGDDASLRFTIHHGVGFDTLGMGGNGGYQLQVRYGNAGGMTSPALSGQQNEDTGVVVWNQAFSLPLQDLNAPIELFIIDTAAAAQNVDPRDGSYLVGGVMVAPPEMRWEDEAQTWSQYRGEYVNLSVTTFERRRVSHEGEAGAGRVGTASATSSISNLEERELQSVALCVSWEVILGSRDDADHTADMFAPVPITNNRDHADTTFAATSPPAARTQNHSSSNGDGYDVEITFEVERVDRYPPHSKPHGRAAAAASAALFCMVRRSDGECSDYVTLKKPQAEHRTLAAAILASENVLQRYSEVDDTGRTCTIVCRVPPASADSNNDEANRVIQLLICEPEACDGEVQEGEDVHEGAPLRVVASTSLLFTALASRGSATFVLDALSEDADEQPRHQAIPFGELCVNWEVTALQRHDEVAVDWAHQKLQYSEDGSFLGPIDGPESDGAGASQLMPEMLDNDVLSVTVVRGIDLRRAPTGPSHSSKLVRPLVAVALGPLLASTPSASVPPSQSVHPRAPCNVLWDQELMFPLPAHIQRSNVMELILQEDHEIVSIGTVSLEGALARSGIFSNVHGGVAEGFEVVALLQEGHAGALGHLLIRWRFVAHNQLAAQARRHERSKSTETEDVRSVEGTPQKAAASSPPQSGQRSITRSPPPYPLTPPRATSRSAPRPAPQDAEEAREPSMSSPKSEARTSPVQQQGSPSPGRRGQEVSTVSHGAAGADDHSPFGSHGSICHHHDTPSQSPRAARDASVSGACGENAAATMSMEMEESDGDEEAINFTEVAAPVPCPRFAFRIRSGGDGRPCVAFYDAASAPPPEEPSPVQQQQATADGEDGVVPPVNAPVSLFRELSQWSSELHQTSGDEGNQAPAAAAAEKDARQLLREELEVRYKNGGARSGVSHSKFPNRALRLDPWYPPGESRDESHVPVSRRESERKQLDAIVELTLKGRFVANQSAARQHRQQQHLSSAVASAAVSHDVSRSTSCVSGVPPAVLPRPGGMHFAN